MRVERLETGTSEADERLAAVDRALKEGDVETAHVAHCRINAESVCVVRVLVACEPPEIGLLRRSGLP